MLKKTLDVSFIILQIILPKHLLSRLIAKAAESEIRWFKNFLIRAAIDAFNINIDEAISSKSDDYRNFNEFFTRELKPGSRTIKKNKNKLLSPSDGAISQIGNIEQHSLIQAKGKYYDLETLLGGDRKLADVFSNGRFATIYLSPRDYHRVHMPCDGELTHSIYVPGELFSVNHLTAQHISGLFARNERLINIFETEHGPMASIMVGAMLVAGIETVWAGHVVPPKNNMNVFELNPQNKINLKQGDEMGRFKFGSTVILLFPDKSMAWEKNMEAGLALQMGQKIGSFAK